MGLFFFRTPKPNRFNHVPIYYDEAKEELENLKRKAEYEKKGVSDKEFKPSLKGQFKKHRINSSLEYGQDQRKKSNFRLLGIVAFLLLLGYLIMQSGGDMLATLLSK